MEIFKMNVSSSATMTPEVHGSDGVDSSVHSLDNMGTYALDSDYVVMPTNTMDHLSSSLPTMTTRVSFTSDVVPTPVMSTDWSSVGNTFMTSSPSLPVHTLTSSSPQLASTGVNSDSVNISITPSHSSHTVSLIQPTIFPSVDAPSEFTPSPTPVFDSSASFHAVTNNVSSRLTPLLTSSPVSSMPKYSPSIMPSSVGVPDYLSTNMIDISPDSTTIAQSTSGNATVPGHVPSPAANISLGLAIALPICIAVVILLLAVILRLLLRKRQKGLRKERTDNDNQLWMNTTLELPPLPPSPVSLENGHIIPLSQADSPSKADTCSPEYEVIHEFDARLDSQLSLTMGQILRVFEKADNGWWRGCHGNKSGWFPGEYVKPVNEKNDPEILEISTISEISDADHSFSSVSHPVKPAVSSFLIRKKGQEDKSPAELLKESKGQGYSTDQNANGVIPNGNIQAVDTANQDEKQESKDAALNSPDCGSSVDVNLSDSREEANLSTDEKYRVCYQWQPDPSNPNRVSLDVNDIVTRLEDIEVGWVRVMKDATGEEGVVPYTYLASLEQDPVVEASHRIQDQLEVNKRLSSGQEHLMGIEHRAIYPYTAQHAEDLSFEEGDVIVVLNALDNGWWHGLKGEEAGWFPGSYVELKESGGNTPPGGFYEKGGNFLSDQISSGPGSQTSSQNSSQADLVRHLSEALLRRKDSTADTVSTASASTLGSDETRPKPVRKAPAPPGGSKSAKRKFLRRPSRPAPPPPAPPTESTKGDNPSSASDSGETVVMRTSNGDPCVSPENRMSVDSSGGHNSDSPGEKPPPPKRFVTPKMVKIPKRKLKLQNSTMLPAPPERPVPPRPPPVGGKSKKSYKKKSSKKSKKAEPKYRGSLSKLSKADISGPLPLEENVSAKTADSVNQMNDSVDLNGSRDDVFRDNEDVTPRIRSPSPVSYQKQRMEKTQSHIPPPVAPKPKNVSLKRLSQNSHRHSGSDVERSPRSRSHSPMTNGQIPVIKVSEPEVQQPVPKPRQRNTSENELNSGGNIPIEIVDNRTKQKKKSLKRTVCNYTGNEGELSFEQGSFIKQINEVADRPGWYMGMLADGTVGQFHESNVEDSTLHKHSLA